MEMLRTERAAAVLQDAGKPHGLLTTTGGWQGRDRPSAADPVPSLYVAHEHYALLYRLATRPAPARTRVELEVRNKFNPGPLAVYNTVGEIPGSEKPDEYVILGAHLDSWDLAQGTTDNGTGSVVVLEAAAHSGTLRGPPETHDPFRPVYRRGARLAWFARLREGAQRRVAACVDVPGRTIPARAA